MGTIASFRLPLPPTTNQLYRNVSGKGRVRTERYRVWSNAAGWVVRAQSLRPVEGDFQLSVWMPPGRDIDNLKAIPDLLGPSKHGVGITPDDKHMTELHVYRDPSLKGECRVVISTRPNLVHDAQES